VVRRLDGRLAATINWTREELGMTPLEVRQPADRLRSQADLAEPLLLMHRSLIEMGMDKVANG
jgi:phosphoenolpyruvate carboxylase